MLLKPYQLFFSPLRQKCFGVVAFYLFFGLSLFGQSLSFEDKDAYQSALEALTVLANQDDILPLHQLDTSKIVVIASPGTDNPVFVETLREYAIVQTMYISQVIEVLANTKAPESLPFNLIIFQIYPEKQTAQEVVELLNLIKSAPLPFCWSYSR